jgi:hypothetical protein
MKHDWVHAILSSDDIVSTLIPVSKYRTDHDQPHARARTPSPGEPDPTPMPNSQSEYFSSESRSTSDDLVDVISLMVQDPSNAISKSSEHFLEWRSVHQREAAARPASRRSVSKSRTAISSSASSLEGMPTVARAQGGGEWEASLSRRVASRRDPPRRHSIHPHHHHHHQPLFPRGVTSVGLSGWFDFLGGIFAPLKLIKRPVMKKRGDDEDKPYRRRRRSPWRGIWVTCAALVAVGMTIWVAQT